MWQLERSKFNNAFIGSRRGGERRNGSSAITLRQKGGGGGTFKHPLPSFFPFFLPLFLLHILRHQENGKVIPRTNEGNGGREERSWARCSFCLQKSAQYYCMAYFGSVCMYGTTPYTVACCNIGIYFLQFGRNFFFRKHYMKTESGVYRSCKRAEGQN